MNEILPKTNAVSKQGLRRLPYVGPILLARPRWVIAILLGVGCYALLPYSEARIRAILGWDAGSLFFVVSMLLATRNSTPELLRQRAKLLDESASVILVATMIGVGISLLAILTGFKEAKALTGDRSFLAGGMAAGTILISWVLTQLSFALHYAHLFYGDDNEDDSKPSGGLDFPDEKAPVMSDFAYFSFVIGMTFQVSDVQITDRNLRIVALLHGLVSFLFNTIIISMAVNIGSGLLS